MRISSAGAVLLLAACSPGADGASEPDPGNTIECSLGGSSTFAAECTVERGGDAEAPILIVRHPDGGFRRLEVLEGGSRMATPDGAEPAQVEPRDGGLEVSVGADRYRFPAKLISNDGA